MYHHHYTSYEALAIPYPDREIIRKVQKFCKDHTFFVDSYFGQYEKWTFKKTATRAGIPVLILSCDHSDPVYGSYEYVEKFIHEQLHRIPTVAI